jgi:hypothetical protein
MNSISKLRRLIPILHQYHYGGRKTRRLGGTLAPFSVWSWSFVCIATILQYVLKPSFVPTWNLSMKYANFIKVILFKKAENNMANIRNNDRNFWIIVNVTCEIRMMTVVMCISCETFVQSSSDDCCDVYFMWNICAVFLWWLLWCVFRVKHLCSLPMMTVVMCISCETFVQSSYVVSYGQI